MAVKKNDPREMVTVHLPYVKGRKGEFVSVNNHRYFIPRGKTVEVPRFIEEVITTSQLQDQHTAEMVEEMGRIME